MNQGPVDCIGCHAPVYAKYKPTKALWDWSKAGDKERKPQKDKYGILHYDWNKGEFEWKESAKPICTWYSGFTKRVFLGDKMDWQVEHEVMPAESALSCVQCHASLQRGRTCNRCHQDSREVDFKKIAHKGTDFSYMASKGRDVSYLIGATDCIDFKALG